MSTPQEKLASLILGEPVNKWLVDIRRETGRSWRLLARDLYDATDGQIDVTHETVRAWANEHERAAS